MYWTCAPVDEIGNCQAATLTLYFRNEGASDYRLSGTLTREGG